MTKPFDEPAFPTCGAADMMHFYGMSLRDYFAGQALHACIRNAENSEVRRTVAIEWAAKSAYSAADAMLAERAK